METLKAATTRTTPRWRTVIVLGREVYVRFMRLVQPFLALSWAADHNWLWMAVAIVGTIWAWTVDWAPKPTSRAGR